MKRRTFLATAGATLAAAALPAPAIAQARRGNRYALQRRFVDWRFGMFLHFNMGTFHDAEWVDPNQDPASFAPTNLDCGQWADAAKAAGMRFAVLTAKHHDGFCLWPSAYTSYDVMSSSYRHDVVGQYMRAFRRRGITPCLYFSIWDRTNGVGPPAFGEPWTVTREQIEFVKHQLTELLTRYGDIPLLIFDGWAWNSQLGHHAVPYGEIRAHVARLQPDCLVLDLNGLTVPWHNDLIFVEEPKGGVFCPPGNTYAASQGQTISPSGWFWHPSTPTNVLSAEQIVAGHLNVLEPRYCTFILNCPPNPDGLLDAAVVDALHQVGATWRPNRSRPPLPSQPDVVKYPLDPVTATATTGDVAAAIDGHSDFGWSGQADQSLWTSTGAPPEAVTLDLGRTYAGIDTLTYLPRQDTATNWSYDYLTDGNVTAYRICASVDGARFLPVGRGAWLADHTLKQARFAPTRARYIRLDVLATRGGGPAIASEIGCGGTDAQPRPVA